MKTVLYCAIVCVIMSILACFVAQLLMGTDSNQVPWDTGSITSLGLLISAVIWTIVAIWAGTQVWQKRGRNVPLAVRVLVILITTIYVIVPAGYAVSYI